MGFGRVPYVYVKIPRKRTIVRDRTGLATGVLDRSRSGACVPPKPEVTYAVGGQGASHVIANAQTACKPWNLAWG